MNLERITLPLVGGIFDATPDFVEMASAVYPAVDIRNELIRMKEWFETHPHTKKTSAGINRFIFTWLNHAQNREVAAHV